MLLGTWNNNLECGIMTKDTLDKRNEISFPIEFAQHIGLRQEIALAATRLGLRYLEASRRARRHLHCCVPAGRRRTTLLRAEAVSERPLFFHLVQMLSSPVDKLKRGTLRCEP